MSAAMLQAHEAGDRARVLDLGRAARRQGTATELSEFLLGVAEQADGRLDAAAATFRQLAQRHPRQSAYWNNLGIVLRQSGQLAAAETALDSARRLAPADPQVHYNLGLLYLQQRRWLPMRAAMLAAVQCDPRFVQARLQAAHACHLVGDLDGARELLADAARWPALPAEEALRLAAMLAAQGASAAAAAILQRAAATAAADVPATALRLQAHRVLLEERCNRLEQAREGLSALPLDALRALPPSARQARFDVHHAHAALAMRARAHAEACSHYRQMLAAAEDAGGRASAGFGLAAAHDRLGQAQAAWQALADAHAAQRELVGQIDPQLLDPARAPLDIQPHPLERQDLARWSAAPAPAAADSPVFVVGFPRSGTTLLEQMLDAHPAFRSLDERPFIHELTLRMEQAGQRYPQDLGRLDAREIGQLRALYARLVEDALGPADGRRLVDKNPLNLLCLPMIARLFPQARIVLCLRHPCDVLLSCYMQPFRAPSFMAMCASLERLAEGYCAAFGKWLEHRAALAPQVLEWRYESVVADVPGHLARLAGFVGVADPAPMAGFAGHARAKGFIGTPSYAQVTEPVHARSVDRWQAYRRWFAPQVLQRLRPLAEQLGYRL